MKPLILIALATICTAVNKSLDLKFSGPYYFHVKEGVNKLSSSLYFSFEVERMYFMEPCNYIGSYACVVTFNTNVLTQYNFEFFQNPFLPKPARNIVASRAYSD